MEHARKLVLVDPMQVRPTIKDVYLSNLDKDISTILNSKTSDEEKVKLYMESLRKYRKIDKDMRPTPPSTQNMQQEVIDSIQPSLQYKAKRLLDRIKNDNIGEWNNIGELIFRQTVIPNSNIVDLVADVLKSKSTEHPTGWKEFANILKETNIPRELINNTERWKYIHQPAERESAQPKSKRTRSKRRAWLEY
jgi:hypothetical protein